MRYSSALREEFNHKNMKNINIKFMGKQFNKLVRGKDGRYRTQTKWEVFKTRVTRGVRRALQLLAISGSATLVILVWYMYQAPPMIEYVQAEIVEIDNLTPKIEELKDEVLDTLKKCESSEATEDDAIIIMDTNKKLSYGLYQFQRTTVQHYSKTLMGQELTNKQAVEVALDGERSRELTSQILFRTDKGYRNWLNCSKRHGLKDKIALIKKLNE